MNRRDLLPTQPEQFSFVNPFGASQLRERIQMMNRPRNRRTGLAVGSFLLLVSCFITWQNDWFDQHLGPFLTIRHGQLYWVLSPAMTPAELGQLQQDLRQHGLVFSLNKVAYDANNRIRRASVRVWSAETKQLLEFEAGTPYGRQPILPIGFQAKSGTCQVGLVEQNFPRRLRELASRYDYSREQKPATDKQLVSHANQLYGLFEVYFLNDLIETNYYGLHGTMIRLTPTYHLDLHREYRDAVIIYDSQEITRAELRMIRVTDIKKIALYKGQAAVMRLGEARGSKGLVVLSRRLNESIKANYNLIHLYEPIPNPPMQETE